MTLSFFVSGFKVTVYDNGGVNVQIGAKNSSYTKIAGHNFHARAKQLDGKILSI